MNSKGKYQVCELPKSRNATQSFIQRRSMEDIVVCYYSDPHFRKDANSSTSLFMLAEKFRTAHLDNFYSVLKDYELRNHLTGKYSSPEYFLRVALRTQQKENVAYWQHCFPNLSLPEYVNKIRK